MTAHTTSAPCRLMSGADRRLRRSQNAADRTLASVRLLAATVVLVTLVLGLSAALRSATESLQSQLSLATTTSESR
jgi:hypothetical protein